MPKRPIPQRVTSPMISAPLLTKVFGWNQTGTTTVTIPLFVALRRLKFRSLNYVAQNATDGTKTLQIKNNTRTVFPTAALTVSGIAALTAASFVNSTTDSDLIVNAGDVVVGVYTVTTAGTVQPGELRVSAELQYFGSSSTR